MKKKIIIIIPIVIILIAVAWLYFSGKRQWLEDWNTYGPLNIMQYDEAADSNDTSSTSYMTNKKDIYFSNVIHIKKGSMKLKFCINDEVVYEYTLDAGEHLFDTDVLENITGKVSVFIYASDDIEGNYTITAYTRETRWEAFKADISEFFNHNKKSDE